MDRLLRFGPVAVHLRAGGRPPDYSVPFVPCAERNSIRMHLDELMSHGVVRQAGERFELA